MGRGGGNRRDHALGPLSASFSPPLPHTLPPQAWFVKQFLTQPIAPRAGLPSRPRPDSAVTLRLNNSPSWREVDPEEVNSWFELMGG